jgi:hypothetical protein
VLASLENEREITGGKLLQGGDRCGDFGRVSLGVTPAAGLRAASKKLAGMGGVCAGKAEHVIGAIAEEISADKTIGGKASMRAANKPKGVDAFFAELIDNEIDDVFEIGVVSGRPDLGRRIGRS